MDYDNRQRSEFALEGEIGRMVSPLTGVWMRTGGHVGGSWKRQEWTVSGGVRFISF
ncbi:MAG: hypothetical protein ACOY3Y_15460 [Acidobacteriota bacterium]